MLIFGLNMPKEHISKRMQAFKSCQSQIMATLCPVIEMNAKNNPPEILYFLTRIVTACLPFSKESFGVLACLSLPSWHLAPVDSFMG